MNETPTALQLLTNLSADEVAARLDALRAEEKALMLLLRSARARERHLASAARDRAKAKRTGGDDAA